MLGCKILIVDDEKTVIRHVCNLIAALGYDYSFLPNPKLLFEKLDLEPVDLILLDINMPGIDGISLLREVKSKDKYKEIPVIMMTGETNDDILAKCFEYGAADYITKPIRNQVLKARVKSVVEKQDYLKKTVEYLNQINEQNHLLVHRNENIRASIHYARKIQEALLPQIPEIKNEIPEVFVYFKPKDVVSGDFYWYLKKDHKFLIAAVDCTGHGVPGAFMSLVGNALLNKIVNEYNIIEPNLILDKLLNEVNSSLKQDETHNQDGMDIAICVIDSQKNTLEYSGAYRPLVYIQDNELYQIKGDRISIGGRKINEHSYFSKHNISLDKETVFYIFSDGFQDQFGYDRELNRNKKFSPRRMRELFMKIHRQKMDDQKNELQNAMDYWQHDEQQTDDILVVGFRLGC